MRLIFTFIALAVCTCVLAQYKLITKNYTPKEYGGAPQILAIEQDSQGLLYFGGDGIVQFDGTEWQKIVAPQGFITFDLKNVDDTIYVASNDDFGYLKPTDKGKVEYTSMRHLLSDSITLGSIWEVSDTEKHIVFKSRAHIVAIDKGDKSIKLVTEEGKNLQSSFAMGKEYYLRVSGKSSLYRFTDEASLKPTATLPENILKGMSQFNEDTNLPGTNSALLLNRNGLRLIDFDKNQYSVLNADSILSDFLSKSSIYKTVKILNGYFLASSYANGSIIFDEHGKTIQLLTQKHGIQDNFIISAHTDLQNNLWLGTNNGISKIAPLPVWKHWNEASGLKGTVESVTMYKDKHFVSTHQNTFFIEEGKVAQISSATKQMNWVLKDVQTSDKKDHLLMGAARVFEIDGDQGTVLPHDISGHVYDIAQSKVNKNRIYCALEPFLISYLYKNGNWQYEGKVPEVKDNIRGIVETDQGEIWLGTFRKGLIKLSPKSEENGLRPEFDLKYYDETNGLPSLINVLPFHFEDRIVFGTTKGLYTYQAAMDSIVPDFTLGKRFYEQEQDIFSFVPHGDKVYAGGLQNKKSPIGYFDLAEKNPAFNNKPFLDLPDMYVVAMYVDENSTVWIGGNEGLYSYNPQYDVKNYEQSFTTVLRKITTDNDSILYTGYQLEKGASNGDLGYEQNDLTFHYASPYYIQEDKTIYSSYLEGYDKRWSTYGNDTKRVYTNLSEGNYTFHVKSKNVYGQESLEARFSFEILAPWYRTPYAYALYLLFGGLFVFFTVKLYTKRLTNEKLKLEAIVRSRTAEIEEQKQQIEALGRFKESMTGMVAHDLKTPLSIIMNANESPATKQVAHQMLQLVNNMLDVHRFESTEMKLNLEAVSLVSLLQRSIDQVRLLAAEKNVKLVPVLDEELMVEVDPELITRVFANFFTNAIKFSPPNGDVVIKGEVEGGKVNISISDQGSGIPKDQLEYIFNAFEQAEVREIGGVGSTGLGLTFCRLVIEAHHSFIEVESVAGQGTTFRFSLGISEKKGIKSDAEDQSTIKLTPKEIELIKEYLPKIKSLKLHQAIKLEQELEPLVNCDSKTVRHWTETVINAAYAGNNEHYEELLDLVKVRESNS